MKETRLISLVCLSICLLATPAWAQGKSGKGHKTSAPAVAPGGEEKPSHGEPALRVQWGFTESERQVMHSYVQSYVGKQGKHAKRLPPGLAKKLERGGKLPPGWQKKCVAGEIMPPAVYDQCHALPPDLVVKLPPPPEPTLTVTVGGKIVRILKASREILDVFDVPVPF